MFLSTPNCKKAFKTAFNGFGLIVARKDDYLYIAGSAWEIQLDYEHIPNKIKAAIIELCGYIPEAGSAFRANKVTDKNSSSTEQITMIEVIPDLNEKYQSAKDILTATSVLIDKKYDVYKLFQCDNGDFEAMNMTLFNLIDTREIDFDNEGMPAGPCMLGNEIFYHTGLCILGVYTNRLETESDMKIKDSLKGIRFEREALQ